MTQPNVPRRRSGKRAGQHDGAPDAPAHFESTSTAHPRPQRKRPHPPASTNHHPSALPNQHTTSVTRDPPKQQPAPGSRAGPHARAARASPATFTSPIAAHAQSNSAFLSRLLPDAWMRYLAYIVLALLAAEIGVIALMYLLGRALCFLCAARYGSSYTCPW